MRNGKEEKNKGSIIKQGNMREWYNRGKKKKKKDGSKKEKVKRKKSRKGKAEVEMTLK